MKASLTSIEAEQQETPEKRSDVDRDRVRIVAPRLESTLRDGAKLAKRPAARATLSTAAVVVGLLVARVDEAVKRQGSSARPGQLYSGVTRDGSRALHRTATRTRYRLNKRLGVTSLDAEIREKVAVGTQFDRDNAADVRDWGRRLHAALVAEEYQPRYVAREIPSADLAEALATRLATLEASIAQGLADGLRRTATIALNDALSCLEIAVDRAAWRLEDEGLEDLAEVLRETLPMKRGSGGPSNALAPQPAEPAPAEPAEPARPVG